MKKICLQLVLLFIGVFAYADTYNISNWTDLNNRYTNAFSGDVLNINGNIYFGGDLTNTPGWNNISIKAIGATRTLYGGENYGFDITNKTVNFENLSFNGFHNAIDISNSTINFSGNNIDFTENVGCAITAYMSSITFTAKNIHFLNNTDRGQHQYYNYVIFLRGSKMSFIDNNINFTENLPILVTDTSKLEFISNNSDMNISFSNSDILLNSAYSYGNNQIIFNANLGRQINVNNRMIIEDNDYTYGTTDKVQKTGAGDLVFKKNSQIEIEIHFDIDEGTVKMFPNISSINYLTIANGATYSMENEEVGKTYINNNATISGELVLDLDFNNQTGDSLYVTGSLQVVAGSVLTANLLNRGAVGKRVRIAQAGTLNYGGFGYDTSYFNIATDGNSLVVELIALPPSFWDVFVGRYQNAQNNANLSLSKSLTAENDSIGFAAPANNNITINGNGNVLDSSIKSDLYFNLNNKTMTFNNLVLKGFRHIGNGGAALADNANLTFSDVHFTNNSASGLGGAIYAANASQISIKADNKDVSFSGNKTNGANNDIALNNASLILNASSDRKITMSGGISGSGNVNKKGAGTLIFNNGAIVNLQGTLTIENGLVLNSNANISVSALTINANGKYSMDNNDGIMNETKISSGTLGGTYNIEIDFENNIADILTLDGGALSIGGKLNINPRGASYANIDKTVAIIKTENGGGISGSFSYDTNHYALIYDSALTQVKLIKAVVDFLSVPNLNDNQEKVANILNKAMNDGKLSDIVNPISNMVGYDDYTAAKKAYDAISGEAYSKILLLGAIDNNMRDIYSRVNLNTVKETGEDLSEIWAGGGIKGLSFASDKNSDTEFKTNGFAAQIGDDIFNDGDHFVGGIYAGFSADNFEQDATKGSLTDIALGIYGGHFYESIRLGWALSAGMQNIQTERDLSFANLKPKANFNTFSARFAGEIKYIADFYDNMKLTPFIGAQGGYVISGEIEEKDGGDANLHIDGANYFRFSPTAGIGIENREGFFQWYLYGYFGYLLAGKDTPTSNVYFANAQDLGNMTIGGQEQNAIFFGGNIGGEFVLGEYFSLYINANIEKADIITRYRFGAGINLKI
ncbi:MAG: hypothetical protein LBV16_00990 [Elusimicrobiota bacterium]|jgi:predicted outer membrane repeat protein|nr:hypothetical protein [Elusimicrobiota bacterium]